MPQSQGGICEAFFVEVEVEVESSFLSVSAPTKKSEGN